MIRCITVLGMNYGDEGKGHLTDYFSGPDCLNVRFNGGAQAAHGVCLSDGHPAGARDHIFHHFGSGSMSGARTLLANRFIVNPILFSQEYSELSNKMPVRTVFIDPRCLVSTHYDMLINSFQSNFNNSNDTCGVGINETIERSMFKQLKINMRDLIDQGENKVKGVLETIKNEYVPYRIKKLNLSYKEYLKYYNKRVTDTNRTIEQFLNVIKFMLKNVVVWPDDSLIERFIAKDKKRYIVFEGAQGMLLDQNRIEYMPFLTRSNTGMKNVMRILQTVKDDIDLTTCLVTRSYLTRHGEGPMFNEFKLESAPSGYENIQEHSNPYNEFQGEMRYGKLDKDWSFKAIQETNDQIAKRLTKNIKRIKLSVAVTCLDHVKIDLSDLNPEYKSNGPLETDIK